MILRRSIADLRRVDPSQPGVRVGVLQPCHLPARTRVISTGRSPTSSREQLSRPRTTTSPAARRAESAGAAVRAGPASLVRGMPSPVFVTRSRDRSLVRGMHPTRRGRPNRARRHMRTRAASTRPRARSRRGRARAGDRPSDGHAGRCARAGLRRVVRADWIAFAVLLTARRRRPPPRRRPDEAPGLAALARPDLHGGAHPAAVADRPPDRARGHPRVGSPAHRLVHPRLQRLQPRRAGASRPGGVRRRRREHVGRLDGRRRRSRSSPSSCCTTACSPLCSAWPGA